MYIQYSTFSLEEENNLRTIWIEQQSDMNI